MPRDFRFPLLLLCFFASGFAALIYQTAWTTQFSYVFGTSELAVATVLAGYMGGLALGAAVAGRLGPRIRRPVLAYGLLELGIALAALALPFAIDASTSLYVAAFGGGDALMGEGGLRQALYYLVSSFAILLVPTALMGATLPLLIRHAVRRESEIGSRVGVLYAANTLGAVGGTCVAGFLLLPSLGLQRTIWIAIGANVLVFATAALLARGAAVLASTSRRPQRAATRHVGSWILPVMLISGAASFSYEVLWTRLLGHLLGGSVFAFATMLGSFLMGIALGAALSSRIATSPERAARGFARLQIGTALLSVAAFIGLDWMPDLARTLENRVGEPLLVDVVVAAATLLPSTLCIGGTFPLAVRILARDQSSAAPESARVYAWNTLGAIFGAVGAGFFLIPALGFAGTLTLAVATNFGLALATTLGSAGWRRPAAGVATLGILVLAFFQPAPPWQLLRSSPLIHQVRSGAVVYYAVGRSATVLLFENLGAWTLRTNGLAEAHIDPPGTPVGIFVSWLAGVPSLARPEARSMLVIGLGGGTQLEAVPSTIASIDVVEIEPEVIEANRRLASLRGRDPLADPRLELVVNDARGALALSSRRYDVIVSQPSHPWTAGASHLYTREFFELVRAHLSDAGVFAQWMGLEFVDGPLFQILVATLTEVFPHVEVYRLGPGALLLGSTQPLALEAGIERALAAAPEDFAPLGLLGPEDVAAARAFDEAGARAFAAGAPVSTDDRNFLAMRSPAIVRSKSAPLDLDALAAPFDPLVRPTPQLDRVYLVSRLLDFGKLERAERVARATTDPGARAVSLALIAARRGEQATAIEMLERVLHEDPTLRSAQLALLAVSPGLEGNVLETFSALGDGPAALRVGRRLQAEQDWAAIASLDARLARVELRDLVQGEATRLRVLWRLASGDPGRAREAMAILDGTTSDRGLPIQALLRARAAVMAGEFAGAYRVVAPVAMQLKGPGQARQALAVLAMIPADSVLGTERAQIEGRLERIARAGRSRRAPLEAR